MDDEKLNADAWIVYVTYQGSFAGTTPGQMARTIDALVERVNALTARIEALEAKQPRTFSEDGVHG